MTSELKRDLFWAIAVALACCALIAAIDASPGTPIPAQYEKLSTFAFVYACAFGLAAVSFAALAAPCMVLPYALYRAPLTASAAVLGGTLLVIRELVAWLPFPAEQELALLLIAVAAMVAGAHLATRLAAHNEGLRAWLRRLPAVVVAGSLLYAGLRWALYLGATDFARVSPARVVLIQAALALLLALPLWRAPAASWLTRTATVALTALFMSPAAAVYSAEFRSFEKPVLGQTAPKVARVILILIDTLRADAVSAIGGGTSRTPAIDRFAADAVLFERAVSPAPWTFPSMNTMMTGVAPYMDHRNTRRTAPHRTLAANFAANGYHTRGIVGNHILFRPMDVTAGFDEIDTYGELPEQSFGGDIADWLYPKRYRQGGITREITGFAERFLDQRGRDPFFLWLHYFDPHLQYAPPEEFTPGGADTLPTWVWRRADQAFNPQAKAVARALYDGEVRYVDHNVGQFLDSLRERGLYDDSLIILTSDHGEAFWEHGDNAHGYSLYQEELHVPLIIRPPGGGGGKRVRSFVPVQALAPTILELCGLAAEKHPSWVPSLTPLLAQDAEDRYDTAIFSSGVLFGELRRSIVLNGAKYVYNVTSQSEELYDLETDPAERISLVNERPEIMAAARKRLKKLEAIGAQIRQEFGLEDPVDPASAGADAEMERRLRSLGYIQ